MFQVYGKLPVLKITNYELYNRSFVVVKDFAVLEIFDAVLGSPDFLTKQDYETIKAVSKLKPNQVHPKKTLLVSRVPLTNISNR